jgi:HAMP domain-containing protein
VDFLKNISLTTKLLVSLSLVVLVTGGTSIVSNALVISSALEKEFGKQETLFAQSSIRSIDRILSGRIENLQTYAHNLEQYPIFKASNDTFSELGNIDEIQRHILEKDEEWRRVNDTSNSFIASITGNNFSEEIRRDFEMKDYYVERYGYMVFDEVFVTNRYGTNIAQSQKTSDYYQADEEWWQIAKEEGLFVSDVEFDDSSDNFSLELAVRIEDENGDFLGVIKALLNIEDVIHTAKEFVLLQKEFSESSDLKLLTANGVVIFSSKEGNTFFEDISDSQIWEKVVTYPIEEKEFVNYFSAHRDGVGEDDGFFAFAYSKGHNDFKGLGWIVLLEKDVEEVFAPVSKVVWNIASAVVILITVLLLLGWRIIVTLVVSPINYLTSVAEDIAKGHFDRDAVVSSRDELGKLAGAFNTMKEKLRLHQVDLEKQVAERTKELQLARDEEKEKVTKLDRVNKLMVDREIKMVELKNELKSKKK